MDLVAVAWERSLRYTCCVETMWSVRSWWECVAIIIAVITGPVDFFQVFTDVQAYIMHFLPWKSYLPGHSIFTDCYHLSLTSRRDVLILQDWKSLLYPSCKKSLQLMVMIITSRGNNQSTVVKQMTHCIASILDPARTQNLPQKIIKIQVTRVHHPSSPSVCLTQSW